MLSRPMINASTILKCNSLAHDSFVEQYARDDDFKDMYEALTHGNKNEKLDYHVHKNILYYLGKLYIPKDEKENVIEEAHTSHNSSHFRVRKIVAQL